MISRGNSMKSRQPDVSVIIPTHNYGHYIVDCLKSVCSQDDVNKEIIVVDDGSTDGTREIIEKQFGKIRYVFQENAGLSAARNTGLRLSQGRYVQFLDADDLLSRGCLSAKLNFLDKLPPASIGVCRSAYFRAQWLHGVPRKAGSWRLYTSCLDVHLCRLNIAPPHAFLIPRSIVEDVGFFDDTLKGCEDYDYWLRALGSDYHFYFCGKALVYYRKHAESMGVKKAKKGEFPFDVLVHLKKHQGRYGAGVADALTQTTGKLAMADGVLRTALMIDPVVNNQGRRDLGDIACNYISDLIDGGLLDGKSRTLEERIYIQRLIQIRRKINSLGNPTLERKVMQIWRVYGTRWRAVKNLLYAFPYRSYESMALVSSTLKASMPG